MSKVKLKSRASICLDDLKEKNKKKAKNGKTYYNFDIIVLNEKNNYGKDVMIVDSQTKEERLAKVPTNYIGQGEVFNWDEIKSKKNNPISSQPTEDDLPF
jgi:hypothetical protein